MQDELKSKHGISAEENLGLVHHCANRFRGRGIEYEELYGAGCLGLMKAVHGYDESRGVQFSTYAVPVIIGELKKLFRDGGMVKVSRRIRENAICIRRAEEAYIKLHGTEPLLSQLSKLTGISEQDCAQALCVTQTPMSLTVGEDDESSQLEVADEQPWSDMCDKIALRQTLELLDEKDRQLLSLRYFSGLTQTLAAKELGLTQVQVSRREKKLLAFMREEMSK